MKYEDLNQYDQQLLNTDLGEFEKEAAEKLAEADEVYAYGQQQAHAIADEMDALMAKHAQEEEEEEEEEEEMDEESEKKAAELGAFIERGMFDELTKLGSERHGDPLHYYYPYMEEKIAQIGAEEKLAAWADVVRKGKDLAQRGLQKTKDYHAGLKSDIMAATTGKGPKEWVKGTGKHKGKKKLIDTKYTPGARAQYAGQAALKASPHLAALGLTGYGVNRAMNKKK